MGHISDVASYGLLSTFTLLEDLDICLGLHLILITFSKGSCSRETGTDNVYGIRCVMQPELLHARIIDSPRERLIATITNNFVPCNGRFPALIALSYIYRQCLRGFSIGYCSFDLIGHNYHWCFNNSFSVQDIIKYHFNRFTFFFYS